jgi:hypothetical protein
MRASKQSAPACLHRRCTRSPCARSMHACKHALNRANTHAGLLFKPHTQARKQAKYTCLLHIGAAHAHACARSMHACKHALNRANTHADLLSDSLRTCAQASKVHMHAHIGAAHAHARARSMHACKHALNRANTHARLLYKILTHMRASKQSAPACLHRRCARLRAACTHANTHSTEQTRMQTCCLIPCAHARKQAKCICMLT